MSGGRSKKSLFLHVLPPEKRAAWDGCHARLDAILATKCSEAKSAYPTFSLTEEELVTEIAKRCDSGGVALEEVVAADLYLCCACLRGQREAIDVFERDYFPKAHAGMLKTVPRYVADETIQRLRISLFLPNERRAAKLTSYTGRVPLGGWLSIVAQRELASVTREMAKKKGDANVTSREVANVPSPASAEADYFKQVNDNAIRSALAGTFRGLSADERKILTWLVKEGASIDVISARLAVHRSTAARMINRAKARMIEGVREGLRTDLKVSESSLDSICASMAVRLDVTLNGIISNDQ